MLTYEYTKDIKLRTPKLERITKTNTIACLKYLIKFLHNKF